MRNATLILILSLSYLLPVRSGKGNHIMPWEENIVRFDPHKPFYQRPRTGWYVCSNITRFDWELSHFTSDPEAYYIRAGDAINVYQILMNVANYDLFGTDPYQYYFIGYSFHIDSYDEKGRPVKRNWPVNCSDDYDSGWQLNDIESFVYFGKRQPTPDEAWTILHPDPNPKQGRREEERGDRERGRMEEERKRRRDREEERRKRRERMIHQLTTQSARSGGIPTGARRSDPPPPPPPPHPDPPILDYRDPKKDDIYVGTRKNETEILMWLVAFVNQDSVSSCPDVPSGTIGTWCYHEDEQADPMDKEPLEWFCRRVKKGELIRFTP